MWLLPDRMFPGPRQRRCPARKSLRPSRAEVQMFTYCQVEACEPEVQKWARCELRYRHKGFHYAHVETEGRTLWWKRRYKRK